MVELLMLIMRFMAKGLVGMSGGVLRVSVVGVLCMMRVLSVVGRGVNRAIMVGCDVIWLLCRSRVGLTC